MIKKISPLVLSILIFLSFALPAFAKKHKTTLDPCPKQAGNKLSKVCDFDISTVENIIRNGITIMFIAAVILAVVFLIYGGIKWITSGGDKAKLEGARNTIVAAIIGLILVFSTYFIINIVFQFFGLNILTKFTIPTL